MLRSHGALLPTATSHHLPVMSTATAIAKPSTTSKPIATRDPEQTQRVSGKVRVAIEAMVWEGLPRAAAATKAGISEHGLYKALRKPPVKQHYLAECEVLRTSGRARRIHRLEAMLEQDDNKAAVINAALALDRMDPAQVSAGGSMSAPGLVIVVNTGPQQQFKQVGDEPPVAISTTYERNSVHGT